MPASPPLRSSLVHLTSGSTRAHLCCAPGGSALGTLCVIDTEPRASFSETEREVLRELASVITDQMEQRLARRLDEISRHAQERKDVVRRKLQEAIRHAQSLFIGGAEPEEVFSDLLAGMKPVTGSGAGCIASFEADGTPRGGNLSVCASLGEHNFIPLMELTVSTRQVAQEKQSLAFPAFHGDQIVGIIAFEQGASATLVDMRVELEPFLDSVAALFVASRARRVGRHNARAIRLRDRLSPPSTAPSPSSIPLCPAAPSSMRTPLSKPCQATASKKSPESSSVS